MPKSDGALKPTPLLELKADEFSEVAANAVKEAGEPAYRVEQLKGWLYERTPLSFQDMEGLPRSLRTCLEEQFIRTRLNTILTSCQRMGPGSSSGNRDGTKAGSRAS